MPSRAPRACPVPRCPNLVTERGRCRAHKRQGWRAYERRRPDRTETKRFYASAEWRKARALALERTGGRCGECSNLAAHVDHITPVKDGGHPTDQANLVPLCLAHHSAKTARENRAAGRW
jgi:5-methylcytosine-specific restriction endonuclease McrA